MIPLSEAQCPISKQIFNHTPVTKVDDRKVINIIMLAPSLSSSTYASSHFFNR